MGVIRRLSTRALQRQVSRIDELYQRHAGEECYLFGSGISLKWMDLGHFADRLSIVGNTAIYHKEMASLNIPYCTITNPFFFYPYRHFGKFKIERNRLHGEFRKSMVANPETLFFVNYSNYPVARYPNVRFVSPWYEPPFATRNPFRERNDSYDGTLKCQLSLAIFLGFRKVYLVGHDYTHLPSRTRHYFEKGRGDLIEEKDYLQDFFSYAKQYIEMVTVTLDGTSEALNFVTYEGLTGKQPHFRENLEIVDRVKLESLATWHGYSIF